MSIDNLEQTIRAIITELTAVPEDEIGLEDRLREDLGMDSVSSMELISMLSEELDCDVERDHFGHQLGDHDSRSGATGVLFVWWHPVHGD